MTDSNGLLMLWKAAEELEGSEIENMILQARNRRNYSLKILKSKESSVQNGTKSQIPIRHSHNELEKCRRAHLRHCMERLKKVLKFDQDTPTSRVTMLSVLKKASTTIRGRERSIHNMNIKETMAKNRFVELTNKLNNLQRQYKRLKNIQLIHTMEYAKADRIRNYSECSVLTTSSDESNIDAFGRCRQLSTNSSNGLIFNDRSNPVINYELSHKYVSSSSSSLSTSSSSSLSPQYNLQKIPNSGFVVMKDQIKTINNTINLTSNNFVLSKCSSPNSNSCDSGFEETHSNNNKLLHQLNPSSINNKSDSIGQNNLKSRYLSDDYQVEKIDMINSNYSIY